MNEVRNALDAPDGRGRVQACRGQYLDLFFQFKLRDCYDFVGRGFYPFFLEVIGKDKRRVHREDETGLGYCRSHPK